MGIVLHVGRRTRTVYRTPVIVLRTKDGFRIALTYGQDAEWVENALAHGAVRLVTRRQEYELSEPELVVDPAPPARAASARVGSCGSCGCRSSSTSSAPALPADRHPRRRPVAGGAPR